MCFHCSDIVCISTYSLQACRDYGILALLLLFFFDHLCPVFSYRHEGASHVTNTMLLLE
jgi:hypothetical protein